MKILLCNNYHKIPCGEAQVFFDESQLLKAHGHDVLQYTKHNDATDDMNQWTMARKAVWNREVYLELRDLICRERPAVIHFTNTFPLISPAAYHAAKAEGIPVIQSLHNYRLICPNAVLLRNDRICEECSGRYLPWPAIRYRCYRESLAASAVVVAMQGFHNAIKTWTKAVTLFIALTDFSKKKFIAGGLPAEKLMVKANFVNPDPGPGSGSGHYAVFVGRLSSEKGIATLLDAWNRLSKLVPLKIIGDGPLAESVQTASKRDDNIEWLKRKPIEEVLSIVGEAKFLVIPSIWYEGLPRTIVEAYAVGTPVVASKIGVMNDIVQDGQTGVHFVPGDTYDLISKVEQLLVDPLGLSQMRKASRREYEKKYTAKNNYDELMRIYERAQYLLKSQA